MRKKCFRMVVLVAVIGLCAIRVEAAGSERTTPLKEQIVKLLASITMKLNYAVNEKFCRQFFEDFQKQEKIVHVQPIIQADRYDDPALAVFVGKCPTVKWIGGEAEVIDILVGRPKLPEYRLNTRVRDQFGNESVATAHFRLYHVDIDNNKGNGREYVFYRDGFVPEPIPGEELRPVEELDRTLGEYTAVDFEGCATLGEVEVGQGGTRVFPVHNGVIRYHEQTYIYNLHGYGMYRLNPDRYRLRIEKFKKERENFRIVCYWK